MYARKLYASFAAAMLALAALGIPAGVQAGDAEGAGDQSLYQRLGGLAPISVVVSDFLDALIPDPELNENPAIAEARERVPAPFLKYRVTAFICKATGGPCTYHGRNMKDAHAHLDITGSEWDRMVEIFKDVLDRHGVPESEQQDLLELLGTTKDDVVSG